MPELPEVETIKGVLKTIVIGRKITKIDILRDSTITSNLSEFKRELEGKTFLDVTRKGKFLIFHLSDDKVMLSHLRMEGKYYEYMEEEPNSYYSRVVFHLDNGHKLCYDDSRCFGILKATTEQEYLNDKEVSKLGPEPSEVKDIDAVYKKIKKSKHPIKSLITDQSILAGIGNIYADEVLFDCKIHPLTTGENITRNQCLQIVESATKTLQKAIILGGSTIHSYHPGKDLDGKFQTVLQAYGKYGENCPICGTPFNFIKVNGRGTTYCPHCQKKAGAPLKIGIFGKIASGKSTVLSYFKEKGYPCISSDEIVSSLYQEKEIVKQIEKMFNLNFNGDVVDKKILREYLVSHPKDIAKINRFIHPIVRERTELFFKQNKADLYFVEVPLLFESKSENMFDYIIGVDIDEENQLKRLQKRNPQSSIDLKKISSNNKFEENKNKADFIVLNDSNLVNLNKSLEEILSILKENLNQFLF